MPAPALLLSADDALDLVQETFLRAARAEVADRRRFERGRSLAGEDSRQHPPGPVEEKRGPQTAQPNDGGRARARTDHAHLLGDKK